MKDEILPAQNIPYMLSETNATEKKTAENIVQAQPPIDVERKNKAKNEHENSDPFTFYVQGVCDLALARVGDEESSIGVVRCDGDEPAPQAKIRVDFDKHRVTVVRHDTTTLWGLFARGTLRVVFTAFGAAYAFGFVGTVVGILLRVFLRRSRTRAFGLRALSGFIAGCFVGALLRAACAQAHTVLLPVFNRIGRLSEYYQVREGYAPLFWGEDFPEFVGFMMSTPICEIYDRRLGFFKGIIRSAIGMGFGAAAGELFKACSGWWRERSTAEVIRDELEKHLWGGEIEERGLWQEDLSLGFLLGISVVVGRFFWLLLEKKCGASTRTDVIGNTLTLAVMLTAYKISCRKLHAEPVKSALRIARRVFHKGPRWKDPKSLIPLIEVERVRRCSKCNRAGIRPVHSRYDRCL